MWLSVRRGPRPRPYGFTLPSAGPRLGHVSSPPLPSVPSPHPTPTHRVRQGQEPKPRRQPRLGAWGRGLPGPGPPRGRRRGLRPSPGSQCLCPRSDQASRLQRPPGPVPISLPRGTRPGRGRGEAEGRPWGTLKPRVAPWEADPPPPAMAAAGGGDVLHFVGSAGGTWGPLGTQPRRDGTLLPRTPDWVLLCGPAFGVRLRDRGGRTTAG